MDSSPAQGPTITTRGATGVGLASIIGAASSYLALVIAARTLEPARNAEFLTFWSALFWLFGSIGGIQHETTRAVGARRTAHLPDTPRAQGAMALPVGLAVGAGAAVLVAATSPLWGRGVLGDHWLPLTGALAVGGVAFAGHSAYCGITSGQARWGAYSRLVGAEATVRLLLVALVAAVGAGLLGIEVASAAAAGTWLLLVVADRGLRERAGTRGDVPARTMLAHIGQTVLAAAASTGLVVGFTVLLRATTPAAEFATAAPFLLAVTLTRAPLLVPLQAYQGVAISYIVNNASRGAAALRPVAGIVLAVGAVAAAVGGWLGPAVLRLLFGSDYTVSGWSIALLTLAAACLALLTLTGATTLALGLHRAYAAGWVVAFLSCVGVLLLPGSMDHRAVGALAVGPLLGLAIHIVALSRQHREDR